MKQVVYNKADKVYSDSIYYHVLEWEKEIHKNKNKKYKYETSTSNFIVSGLMLSILSLSKI